MRGEGGRGYKSVRIVELPGSPGTPAIGSPYVSYIWTPGINVSTMDPSRKSLDSAGFYAVATPEMLVEKNYYPEKVDIPIEIIPFGDIVDRQTEGFRCHKAEISSIMSGGEYCDVCKLKEAEFLTAYSRPGSMERPSIFTCNECRKRLQSAVKSKKGLGGIPLDELMDKLSDRYQVDIVPLPEALRAARARRGK